MLSTRSTNYFERTLNSSSNMKSMIVRGLNPSQLNTITFQVPFTGDYNTIILSVNIKCQAGIIFAVNIENISLTEMSFRVFAVYQPPQLSFKYYYFTFTKVYGTNSTGLLDMFLSRLYMYFAPSSQLFYPDTALSHNKGTTPFLDVLNKSLATATTEMYTTNLINPLIITITLPTPAPVTNYRLVSPPAELSSNDHSRFPSDWQFHGSNDNVNKLLLDTKTNYASLQGSFGNGQMYNFVVPNTSQNATIDAHIIATQG